MYTRGGVRVVFVLVLSVAGWVWGNGRPAAMACMPPAQARDHGLLIQGLVGTVSQTLLYGTIRELQDDDAIPGGDALGSRYSFAPGLGDKREHIRTRIKQAGLAVRDQAFRLAGTTQVNLEGTLPGWGAGEDLVYILCAHYDSKSDDPERIAPGADATSVYGISLNPRYDARAASGNSDHGNFWVEGHPAILVTDDTSISNPYYHTTGDTVAQLDLVYARKVVQAMVATLAEQAEIIPPELSRGYSGPARATPSVPEPVAARRMAPAWRP